MIRTVSLETSKLLKEAGFKGDTELYWFEHKRLKEEDYKDCICFGKTYDDAYYPEDSWWKIKAPTTDELLEELPSNIDGDKFRIVRLANNSYTCSYGLPSHPISNEEILCEALAKIWLQLKKSNLLSGRGNEN